MAGDAPRRDSDLRITLMVAALATLAPFSIDTYLPSFPDIAAEFGTGPLHMQQTLSFYLLAFAVTTLVYGPLADAFGRRRVTLGALAVYTASSVGCALADGIGALILLRIGQGLSVSAGLVVGRVMVRDLFEGARAQRVMSNVMLTFALAPAVAPVVGGVLHDTFGWRSVFWFLALLALLLTAMVAFSTPETLPRERRQSIHPRAVARVYGRVLSNRRFLGLVVVLALNFGGFFLYVVGAPTLVFEHLGLEATQFLVLFGPLVGGVMLGAFVSGRVAERWPTRRTLRLAFAVTAAAALLNLAQAAWLPASPVTVVAPLALYAFGMALALPSLNLLALDCFPHHRGTASALQSFVQMSSNALVAGVVVPLTSHTLLRMAAAMGAFQLAALAAWGAWLVRERRRGTAPVA